MKSKRDSRFAGISLSLLSFLTWPQTAVEEPYSVLSEGNVYFRKPQLDSQRNTCNVKVKCMKVFYELLRVKYRSNSKEMYRESIEFANDRRLRSDKVETNETSSVTTMIYKYSYADHNTLASRFYGFWMSPEWMQWGNRFLHICFAKYLRPSQERQRVLSSRGIIKTK